MGITRKPRTGGDNNSGFALLEALVLLLIFTLILGTAAELLNQLIQAELRLRQLRHEENRSVSRSAPFPFPQAFDTPAQDHSDSG